MLTDPRLRAQVDAIWDKSWTGELSNPLDAIEQFSYFLFLKRLDDRENAAEKQAKRKGIAYQPKVPKEMRWGYWTQMKAEEALSHLKQVVFPGLVNLAEDKSLFAEYMKGAQCKISHVILTFASVVGRTNSPTRPSVTLPKFTKFGEGPSPRGTPSAPEQVSRGCLARGYPSGTMCFAI